MAPPLLLLFPRKTFSLLLTITFLFLSCFPFSISSLSTVAISETGNLTLICASIHSASSSFLNCTSFPAPGTQTPPSSFIANNNTLLSGIVAGNGFLCSLWSPPPPSSTSVMGCWRFSDINNTARYRRIYHSSHASIKELDAGNSHICGLVNDNGTTTNDRLRLECWQWKGFNSTGFNFSSIAVGEDFVCGLLEFGTIKCIQNQSNGNNNISVIGHEPDGNYNVIAAGFHHACAISSSNGSLECWGEMVGEKPSQGVFTSLALGENRSCAMQASNGTVICWGENNFSLPESLRNVSFVAIEAKQRVFCGIVSSDYSLHCWGTEAFDSNSMVFQNVMPGPCTSKCRPCSSPLPDYGTFCGQGLQICMPCVVGGGNSSSLPLPLPPSPISSQSPPQEGTSGGWNKKMVAFLVVGCVGSFSLVMVCCFLFFRYCQVRGSRIHDSGRLDDEEGTSPSHPQSQAQSQTQIQTQTQTQALPVRVLEKRLSQTISMGNGGGHLEEFSLQELHQATNNFSDDHKIGTGSFGSVYHATLHDERQVAIKRAETSLCPSHIGRSKRQEDKDTAFLNELEFLSRLNHKNLVRLLGYCEDNSERILVYEYMNNGTLHDHLHKHDTRTPLRSLSMSLNSTLISTWAARIKVALDAARGIEYLHMYAVPPIIHRDIKSSNILLDDTWTAKVSDFGLSLMGPPDDESHLSLHAAGTVGYIDPEYYKLQQLTAKSDVYSFGVVMLELLSGYNAIHRNENGVPRNVVDFMVPYIVQDEIHRVLDPNVPPPTPYEIEAVAHVGYLAVDCVKPQARYRPTMSYVVNRLEAALTACLATPPNLSLSRSSTRSST